MNRLTREQKDEFYEENKNKGMYLWWKTASQEEINERVLSVSRYNQGIFKPKNPQKYKGDASNIIFRSSWECRLMSHFDLHENVLSWQSEEVRIPYISPTDNRRHTYYPDFVVVTKNKQGIIETLMIEVKPLAQTKPPIITEEKKKTKRYIREVITWGVNSSKWAAAEKFCAAQGWKFMIMTEKEIFGKK